MTREKIYRGDTPTFVFTVTSGGAAFDLTSATVYFSCKNKVSDSAYIFNELCTIDSPATDGICRVTLSIDDTATSGLHIAELEVTKSGAVHTVIQFELLIIEDVRKP